MRFLDRSWLILSCCLALGLIFSLFLLRHDDFIGRSYGCIYYALSGKNLVSGQGYTVWGGPSLYFPPFYPLTIGIFYKFMGNLELAGRTVSIVSFLISIIILFKLAQLIYNKSVAFLTVILFIMNKFVLDHSYRVGTHSLDILLVTISIYLTSLIIKSEKLKYRNFILLGIILAAAILNRPENIILSLAIIPILFIQKKEQIFKKISAFSYLMIVLVILLFPYANFLHRHTGKWTLSTKITWLKYFEYLSSKDPSAYKKGQPKVNFSKFKPFEYIKKNKRELLGRYLRGIKLFPRKLRRLLYGVFGWILIGLGLFWQAWDKDRRRIQILFLFALSPLAILPLGNLEDRYFLFAIPIFLIWMAKGLENLAFLMKKYLNFSHRESRLAIYLVLILLISPIARFLVVKCNIPLHEHKQMGLWMKDNIKDIEHKKIASRKPYVAFYSSGQFIQIPFEEDYKSLPGYLKKRGIEYLIIDERFIPILRPQLKLLLDEQKKHAGLIKVYVIREPKKIILYQLEQTPESFQTNRESPLGIK